MVELGGELDGDGSESWTPLVSVGVDSPTDDLVEDPGGHATVHASRISLMDGLTSEAGEDFRAAVLGDGVVESRPHAGVVANPANEAVKAVGLFFHGAILRCQPILGRIEGKVVRMICIRYLSDIILDGGSRHE